MDHGSRVHPQNEDGTAWIAINKSQAEIACRSERQMRRVVEGSAQGIVVRTRERILYLNEAFAKLLGYDSARECMAKQPTVDGNIHPDDIPVVLHHLNARLSGEEVVSTYEFRLLRRDRSAVWVETRASMVNWDGMPASLSWLSDISVRKAIESELLRSRAAAESANKEKTQFLATMSHELRTPLNAIVGFSEAMQLAMFGPLSRRYSDYACDIHRSGQHLVEIINDILDLSKLEAGKLKLRESTFPVAPLFEECVALLRNQLDKGRISLVVDTLHSLPQLRADRRALKQVLLNLLSNAVKFTPESGTITLSVLASHGMELSVTDDGVGLSAAEVEIALSPFGQIDSQLSRQHQGTGLGLPISRSLMRLHGGELRVVSKPKIGTTFIAAFPPERVVHVAAVA